MKQEEKNSDQTVSPMDLLIENHKKQMHATNKLFDRLEKLAWTLAKIAGRKEV